MSHNQHPNLNEQPCFDGDEEARRDEAGTAMPEDTDLASSDAALQSQEAPGIQPDLFSEVILAPPSGERPEAEAEQAAARAASSAPADPTGSGCMSEAVMDELECSIPCNVTATTWQFAEGITIVKTFVQVHKIEVMGDGMLRYRNTIVQADSPDAVEEYLDLIPIDYRDLLDRLALHVEELGYEVGRSELHASLRQVLVYRAHERRREVLAALVRAAVATVDPQSAGREWDRVASLFSMQAALLTAILKHYVWEVYQKILGRPIAHHLMPIIFSTAQGSGKTTFTRRFVSPLGEMASEAALLSDFADARSGQMYRYPSVVLDDMEQIDRKSVGILKSLLTAEGVRRRRLGTSESVRIRQGCMPIGTSNVPISELVPDETGHRRFATLPFRNGQVANGGDADVWDTVASLDYRLLWASVDPFGPAPIAPHLTELYSHQRGQRQSRMLEWLLSLDLRSEDVLRITVRQGIKAQGLHELYFVQTGERTSPFRFAEEMLLCMRHPKSPLGSKMKTEFGAVYIVKPQC